MIRNNADGLAVLLRHATIAATMLLIAGCGGGGGDNDSDDVQQVSGIARSVLTDAPQPARSFVVLDLEQPADAAPVANGVTDVNGRFVAELASKFNFIVFGAAGGEPRSSGLVALDDRNVTKDLDDVTDIACQAGVTAIRAGGLDPRLMDEERIDNLEAGAAQVLSTGVVDFTNADSVTAAADQVRALTDDGARPPP